MIEVLKEKVKNVIKECKEITNKTQYNTSGIYMIYINNFEDNKVLPIYIGQTEDFQRRYKQHLSEIMALNRFDYRTYKIMFSNLYYDGRYKSCKIFKYMIEHNCTLKDFHMVLLEEVENDKLDKREQEYFRNFYPEYFGFNQINSTSLFKKKMTIKEYLNLVYEDSINIKKFWNYGFTKENYLIGFYKEPLSEETLGLIRVYNSGYTSENYLTRKPLILDLAENKELLNKININIKELAAENSTNKYKKYEQLIPKLESMKQNLKINIKEAEEKIKKSSKRKIEKYFEENNLSINLKYNDVIDSILYDSKSSYESFSKYLKRKKVNENIIDTINQKMKNIKKNLEIDIKKLNKVRYLLNKIYNIEIYNNIKTLLPKEKYGSYPLKDKFENNLFSITKNDNDNICYINIEFTNSGRTKGFITEPLKVDYYIKVNNNIFEEKDIFLHTKLDNFFEQDINRYMEKDYADIYKIYKERFKIYLATKNNKDRIIDDYISTNIEVSTGINEYTLINKEKTTLNVILKKISNIINQYTKIVYTTSAYKSLILEDKNYLEGLENNLKEKIIKSIKK